MVQKELKKDRYVNSFCEIQKYFFNRSIVTSGDQIFFHHLPVLHFGSIFMDHVERFALSEISEWGQMYFVSHELALIFYP